MRISTLLIGGGIVLMSTSLVYAAEFDEEGDVEPTTPVTGYSIKRGTTASPLPTNSPEATFTPVPEQNIAPLANAGVDHIVSSGALVVLDASKSRDPDGTIVSYNWKQLSGPSIELLSSRTPSASFVAGSEAASHIFQLTVRDSGGTTAIDVVTIVVRPRLVASPTPEIILVASPAFTPLPLIPSLISKSNLLLGVLAVVLAILVSAIVRVALKSGSS